MERSSGNVGDRRSGSLLPVRRRLGLRAGRAARRLAARGLAAEHRHRRARVRFRELAARHLSRTVLTVTVARESTGQSLTGERENDEKCSETLQHTFFKLKLNSSAVKLVSHKSPPGKTLLR